MPPAFNVVLIAFAYGDGAGGGRLVLDLPSFQSVGSFNNDIAELRSQGRSVLLSIGGSNDMGVRLTTSAHVSEMLFSLNGLIATHGFDGIDWDLESTSQVNVPSLLAVSNQLKKQWGSSFAITINSAPSATLYQQLYQQLGPNLDLICHQYYDHPASESTWIRGVRSRVAELIDTYGIAASKIGIGVKTVGPIGGLTTASLTITVATALSTWHSLQRNYPDLRGTYLWSVNLDQSAGYPFARQVSDGYGVGARKQLTNGTLDPARACGPIVEVRHA